MNKYDDIPESLKLPSDPVELDKKMNACRKKTVNTGGQSQVTIEKLQQRIKQYEQIITHLWSWLPIKTRTTYSNDYPPHAKIIGQIRGNDEI